MINLFYMSFEWYETWRLVINCVNIKLLEESTLYHSIESVKQGQRHAIYYISFQSLLMCILRFSISSHTGTNIYTHLFTTTNIYPRVGCCLCFEFTTNYFLKINKCATTKFSFVAERIANANAQGKHYFRIYLPHVLWKFSHIFIHDVGMEIHM